MIPGTGTDLLNDFYEGEKPGRTYRIDGTRITGLIEVQEAVVQAARLVLSTERFAYSIYSWNYGAELSSLNGINPPLVYSLIRQRITEALTVDDRIVSVDDFTFSKNGSRITASCTVNSIYGSSALTKEIELNV